MTAKTDETLRSTPRREIWFESAGTALFAVEVGQGPPLVFIHGGLADHRAALLRIGPLAASYRLLTPDLRGSGRSVHAGPLSWDQLADDMAALLDPLEIERTIVGGTSMGSAVALRFALRHPRRCRALIVMSPVYPGEDRPLAPAARVAMRVMAEAGQRALVHGVEALRPLYERLPAPIRDAAIEMMLGFDAASVAATTRFLATNAQPFSSASELAAIDVPVLLIPGTDPEHPAELAELYARHLRHAIIADAASADLMTTLATFCEGLS